jgi:hypothetical protein
MVVMELINGGFGLHSATQSVDVDCLSNCEMRYRQLLSFLQLLHKIKREVTLRQIP